MVELIQYLAQPPTTFRFLELPLEIQTEVVNQISRPSELKVLCLVSKEIRDIAIPRLYYRVDLISKFEGYKLRKNESNISAKISSLLSGPSNLRFIRILNTGCFGFQTTEEINALLPQLQDNALTEINFSIMCPNFFPTREQIHFLWSHQRKLQNIQMQTDHIPFLIDVFEQTQELRNRLPKSVTRLMLASYHLLLNDALLLPLKIVNMSRLRSLSLNGAISSKVVYQLNRLFASRSFFTLTDLHVELARFEETLELSNLPFLDLLSFWPGLVSYYDIENKGLVVPEGFLLRKIVWINPNLVDQPILPTVLSRVKSLEHLQIKSNPEFDSTTGAWKALAKAIEIHETTLKTLVVDGLIKTEASAYDEQFLRPILMCKQLEVLYLPLPPNKPVAYYTNIIASLPCLREFRIYHRAGARIDGTEPRSVELVEALQKFPRIEYFGFSERSNPHQGRRSHCLIDKRHIIREF